MISPLPFHQVFADGADERRTGGGATCLGEPSAAFPRADARPLAVFDLGQRDIGAFEKDWMMLKERANAR